MYLRTMMCASGYTGQLSCEGLLLWQAAQINREKGLSAAGSKAALAGDANLKQETCSLYKVHLPCAAVLHGPSVLL